MSGALKMTTNYFLLPALNTKHEKVVPGTVDTQAAKAESGHSIDYGKTDLSGLGKHAPVQVQWFNPAQHKYDNRPRKWTPEARAASEFLSRSLEYLAYTRELPSGRFMGLDAHSPDTEAILILMEAKRHVYQTCPYIERRKGNLFGWKGQERRQNRNNK